MQVRLEDIHEYTPEIRIALKRNNPHITTVNDKAAQPEKQTIEATSVPQRRRPGVTLHRWPGKPKKS